MKIATKTMYSNGKTILGHKTNDFGHKKHCQKIKKNQLYVKFHDFWRPF